ncbi:MAG: DUF2088 domain-containing protein [Anaerolineales bacterium]|nr:DUF2088 domain-containing protein [Anaerolineales bacterium]
MGYTKRILSESDIRQLLDKAISDIDVVGKRILILTPDNTRTAPIPLFFRQFFEILWDHVGALDYLVALGTHPPLNNEALNQLMGITAQERSTKYKELQILNHQWDLPETLTTVGIITHEETEAITEGLLSQDVYVRVNKLIFDYDLVIVCGPVFPHEVVGFSGGNKYFFPGISGPDFINFTHWLGALITSTELIGIRDTPVRTLIERAVAKIEVPVLYCNLVVTHDGLSGLYLGADQEAWRKAVELSERLHIRRVEKPFNRVLSIIPEMYDDIWTAAKGMYKLDPVIADGGEVVIYAPHITEISYTHGKILDEIGYHVRDYFVKQWAEFKDYPWGIMAHSTHLRGVGEYDLESGMEQPRIDVTLATGIPRERCEGVNLGYRDPTSINLGEWEDREQEGILVVQRAGEMLYRLKKSMMTGRIV